MKIFNTRLSYLGKSFFVYIKIFSNFKTREERPRAHLEPAFLLAQPQTVGPVCPECLKTKRKNSIDSQQSKKFRAPRETSRYSGQTGQLCGNVESLLSIFPHMAGWMRSKAGGTGAGSRCARGRDERSKTARPRSGLFPIPSHDPPID